MHCCSNTDIDSKFFVSARRCQFLLITRERHGESKISFLKKKKKNWPGLEPGPVHLESTEQAGAPRLSIRSFLIIG